MATTAKHGGLGPGTTRPLTAAEKAKRDERQRPDVPLAWALRDHIEHALGKGIPPRPDAPFVLAPDGVPSMPPALSGYIFGPRPRALMMALRRLSSGAWAI